MRAKKFNSQALRQYAKEFLRKVAEDETAPDVEREDFETSLIRQWQTYEGNASVGDNPVPQHLLRDVGNV